MGETTTVAVCDTPIWGTCLRGLAGGWIGVGDLCDLCTARFVSALDAAVPGLEWCDVFATRAERGNGRG